MQRFALGMTMTVIMVGSASAHHSFAMFDNTKTVVLSGTVQEFQWTNPHSWIELNVEDPATKAVTLWSIEGPSPLVLGQRGWTRHAINPGDTASITVHLLKDATPGAELITATVNGKLIGTASPVN